MHLFHSTCILVLLVTAAGCGSDFDNKASLDAQIEAEWFENRQLADAVSFFENGGVYEDSGEPGDPAIDQPTVLPLVRQLRDTLELDVQVVIEEPGEAFALLIAIPKDESKHQQIRDMLNQADEEFFGVVMHNWGHRWISLDFLNELETKMLSDAGVLDKLRSHQQQ